jgi:hypothetical protein
MLLIIVLALSGCLTLPDAQERKHSAMQMATDQGWEFSQWKAADFVLAGFAPRNLQASTLRIYIEGDGLAWITSRRPSKNPTPVTPVSLKLALLDQQPSVYLARPCQYVMPAAGCSMKYWTSHRYAEEVVSATSEALSQIKKRHGAQKLELFGYSGGAAIAALVAARRDDVTRLITVAGNMDHEYWTAYHKVSPLNGSLNPADYVSQLQMIRQIHLVGDEDDNVPLEVINAYLSRIHATGEVSVHVIPDYDHECCWSDNWQRLLKIYDK